MLSINEENYLKAILKICWDTDSNSVGTNSLASHLEIKPSSVNEMLKKLRAKKLIEQERYGKIFFTELGKNTAVEIVRKHRIWETFLHKKLNFTWDEVHDVAEQLEHIQSTKLTDRLYEYLGKPTLDPHGEPIPDAFGNISKE